MENLIYAPSPHDWNTPPPNKIRILVVDDEVPLLIFIEEILARAGHTVIAEKNSANAINLAICMQPDIILLDVVMPDIDGFSICKQLKQHHQIKNTPIIFLSICDRMEDRIKGLELGGVDYMTKPIDGREMLIRVRKHIEISWIRHSLEKTIQEKENQLQHLKGKLDKASKFIVYSDSPYKKILSLLETGVVKIDNHFTCIMANDAAAHLLGFDSPEEMIGNPIIEQGKHKVTVQPPPRSRSRNRRQCRGSQAISGCLNHVPEKQQGRRVA